MKPREKILSARLRSLYKKYNLDVKQLSNAVEIVIFGSWSVGAHREDSDLDVLLVGHGKRVKRMDLDIIVKSVEECRGRKWLGSELANHIASYGIWLTGKGEWRSDVFTSQEAKRFKRRLIVARTRGLEKAWNHFGEIYRRKHVTKLRRDLQRLVYLSEERAVPPTVFLDREWSEVPDPVLELERIVHAFDSPLLVNSRQFALFKRLFRRDWLQAKSAC